MKCDGWDGDFVSIPWGARAERSCGRMHWLSCASPNTGPWSRSPAWPQGIFVLVVLKSFLGTRASSLDMSLNHDCS